MTTVHELKQQLAEIEAQVAEALTHDVDGTMTEVYRTGVRVGFSAARTLVLDMATKQLLNDGDARRIMFALTEAHEERMRDGADKTMPGDGVPEAGE